MSEDWPRVPLGEVLTPVVVRLKLSPLETYREVTVRWWGKGLAVRREMLGAETATAERVSLRPGQFIISRIDALHGASGVVPDALAGGVVTNDFPVYAVNESRLVPAFLGWYSKTAEFVELCRRASEGTTNRIRLKEDRFRATAIPLPPFAEQRRIVERVEAVASRIAEAKRLREEATREREAIIGQYLRLRLSGVLAADWQQGKLGDLVTDCSYGTSEKTDDDRSGVPVLRMGNIQDGRLILTDLKYLPHSAVSKDGLLLESGDILVNRTNSAELVGKCAVFESPVRYSFASYLIRIRPEPLKANSRFIASYINSPIGREYMFAERRQMTGQANVNSKILLALPIPIPPLPEQQQIVAHLDALQAKVDSLRALQLETATELDSLLPSVLNRAFAGKL